MKTTHLERFLTPQDPPAIAFNGKSRKKGGRFTKKKFQWVAPATPEPRPMQETEKEKVTISATRRETARADAETAHADTETQRANAKAKRADHATVLQNAANSLRNVKV